MVADGTGFAHYSMLLANNQNMKVFNKFDQSCLYNTSPTTNTNTSHKLPIVTESAQSASNLSTGKWNTRYSICMTKNKKHQPFGQKVKKKLKNHKVGLIVSTDISDATPAAFFCNAHDRGESSNIKKQLDNVEFDYCCAENLPTNRQKNHFNYKRTKCGLSKKIKNCLTQFKNDKFFLMIEESQIDKESHANDMPKTIKELNNLSCTVKSVFESIPNLKHPVTFILLSDHATGSILIQNNLKETFSEAKFNSDDHDHTLVPAFLYSNHKKNKLRLKPVCSMLDINNIMHKSLKII